MIRFAYNNALHTNTICLRNQIVSFEFKAKEIDENPKSNSSQKVKKDLKHK